MNIQWSEIKNKMFKYAKRTFKDEGIVISDDEIIECIDVFYNVLKARLSYGLLNGIDREMLEALQVSCCDNIGSLKDLRVIATLVDSFLKRILLITQKKTYNEVQDKGTKQLFIFTQIDSNFTMQSPRMTDTEVEKYKGNPNGLYLFAKTDFYRNEVHSSNDLLEEEVISYLRYIVAFYLYVIYRFKKDLLAINPTFSKAPTIKMGAEQEDRMLYDLMNFGHSQNALKNQIIQSYILYQIKNNKTITKADLVANVVAFSRGSLQERSVIRQLEKLKDKIDILPNNIVCLKEEEKSRLTNVYANYNERMSNYEQQIDDLINQYSLSITVDKFSQLLRTFFENNFNTDIIEATDTVKLEEVDGIDSFFEKLISIGCSRNHEKELFQDILNICKNNDIIIRLSLGKLFTNIANPDAYDTYVSMTSRCVYLDTQIVLYMLCNNISYNIDCPSYDTIRNKIAKDLLELRDSNKTIRLQFSSHYLREVVYQIRQAFLLIPLSENIKEKTRISSNVFYCYYYYLNKENKLPYNIDSFCDFMHQAFDLEEEMAYKPSFWSIAEGYIKEILTRDIGIEIVQPIYCKEDEIEIAKDVYCQALRDLNTDKGDSILQNDIIMGLTLFNHPINEPDPFFLTWDASFSKFRKKYISQVKRLSYLYWHLFSPSKFINHLDLIDFKIDISKITDDLMSAIETDEYKNTTKSFIDQINRMLDIPGLDGTKRRKYFKAISKEFFNDNEFPCEVDAIYAEPDSDIKKFADTFDKLIDKLKDANNIKEFNINLQNEEFFNGILKLVQDYIKKVNSTNLYDSVIEKMAMNNE